MIAASGSVQAYDVDIRADTYAQAYQLRGPSGAPVISSQRVTQTLALAIVQRPSDPRGITVTFRLRLRFDADFGEACDAATNRCLDETNRDRGSEFVPIFARRTMDLSFAYLDITNIAHGVADVRVGRMFQVDPLGFFLFDGARTRFHLGGWVVAEALGGLETRSGFAVSDGRFERDGLIRADRTGWDPSVAPYVLHPEYAPVVGFALETERIDPVFARVSYRRVWTASGISEEKVGGGIDARIGTAVRVYANAVYSIPQQALSSLVLSADWRPIPRTHIAIEFERFRPTFDLNAIWSVFWLDPTDEARVRGELPISRRIVLTAHWMVRRYAFSETGPSAYGGAVGDAWNTGGSGALRVIAPTYQGALSGHVEGGSVGLRAGLDANAWWWLVPHTLRLDARLSLWHVEDQLRPDRAGFSFGAVVGATVQLGRIAELHTDFEDDVNRFVGQRFRAMAILAVRASL